MRFDVGDVVYRKSYKLFMITDKYEGFYQAKPFVISDDPAITHPSKLQNPLVKSFKKIQIDDLDKFWSRIQLPKNKFQLHDKVYFIDDRSINRIEQIGFIQAITADLKFGSFQTTEITTDYTYFLKIEHPNALSPVAVHMAKERNLRKIINTNRMWNDVCQDSSLTK